MVRGANLPPIIVWKVSNTLGSFSFSRSYLSLVCFGLLIFSGEGGRSSSASRDHFQCLSLENFVFWQCSLLVGSASSLECNQSGCGVVHLGYAMSIFWMLCDDQNVFANTRSLKVPTPEVWVLSHLCHHWRRVHKCLASFHKYPCPLMHSSLLVQQECPSSVSDQWSIIVVWCWGVCLYYCDPAVGSCGRRN